MQPDVKEHNSSDMTQRLSTKSPSLAVPHSLPALVQCFVLASQSTVSCAIPQGKKSAGIHPSAAPRHHQEL